MYAIIRDAGRQHKVVEGQSIAIDRVGLESGDEVEFAEVLLLSGEENVTVGTPTVKDAKVIGEVKGVISGPKVFAVQYRRRKNSRRKVGHRQKYTEVRVTKIVA